MGTKRASDASDIGLVGLGVMGRNFALNIADQGFKVAGFNRDPVKIEKLEKTKAERHNIRTTNDIEELCGLLRPPRAVMMLVPAGKPVDAVIESLLPHLEPGDLIIDSGNSHFTDTDRRGADLEKKGIRFMGLGMSGGADGARHGPSLMPGGPKEAWHQVRPILEATAAHVEGSPCVAYLGPGSAGHYVKMVHNGIEYGVMQLIAETYDLMRQGLGLHPDALHMVYKRWNHGPLESFLMEITAEIFLKRDDRTDQPLIDRVLDQAKQKGTGMWTVADALEQQVPIPTIDAAVMMRHLSGDLPRRKAAAQAFEGPVPAYTGDHQQFIDRLENALHAAVIVTYAQGMALLRKASRSYTYDLDPATIARIWSGGCIIRAALLKQIASAYRETPDLVNLMTAPQLDETMRTLQSDLRDVVRIGAELGIPLPGLMSALAYYDAYRSPRLPANLTMAQRDYFGSHTYERIDAEGTFHTEWDAS